MVDHLSVSRDFSAPFEGLDPRTVGSEDCESLFAHLKTKKLIAEKNLARHFQSNQETLEQGELGNVYWSPGTENPTNGLTKVRSDAVPPLRILESGRLNLGFERGTWMCVPW